MADLDIPRVERPVTEEEIKSYEFKGRDPRGLLIEKEIHIEIIDKRIIQVTQRLYQISRKNLELEQEISMHNRRFRDLLQAKSKASIPAYLFEYFMKSHPLIADEDDMKRAMAGLDKEEVIAAVKVVEDKDKEPDPEIVARDIRIEELE